MHWPLCPRDRAKRSDYQEKQKLIYDRVNALCVSCYLSKVVDA